MQRSMSFLILHLGFATLRKFDERCSCFFSSVQLVTLRYITLKLVGGHTDNVAERLNNGGRSAS
jgi:hypothetical protein